MKITYTARKVNLRDNFKERVEKKLSKFNKLFSSAKFARIRLSSKSALSPAI